ncbi:MAG: sugar phosphate isomerase/epimerase [Clostridia bacterium]|nr:sugar phosphate isomerase/epimerase [Clostridia bacterium]
MKRKLGINASCLRGISQLDALSMIKAAGFDTFFTGHFESSEEVGAIKKKADELGLVYEFIHAPFNGINEMWMPGLGYLTMFDAMKQSIDHAAEHGVPAVITHVSSGWTPPQVNDLGLSRYDDIVLYAKDRGVTVAFENLRLLGNLAVLVDRYEHMDNVRFCFDCGHEHCYTKTVKWLDIFTNKVCCTHIHDNMGRPFDDKTNDYDSHMLPFDGTYDYEQMMRKLDEYGYAGPLTLEVGQNRPDYQAMSPEAFLATCYERIKKISEM